MTQYHKIWIEVDVTKEPQLKTQKMANILKLLSESKDVANVTKMQYIGTGEKVESMTELKEE